MKISRRKILGGIAAAPVVGPAMAEQAKMGMLGQLGVAGLSNGAGRPAAGGASNGGLKFLSFADWLKQVGDRQIRESARYIGGFDPDLIERRLPLATKVRIQRERNYQRELVGRRRWIEEQLSLHGVIEWWA